MPLEPGGFLKPPFHTYVVFFLSVLPQKLFENGLQALTGSPQNFWPSIVWFARVIQLAMFVGMVWVVYSIVRRASGVPAARATALVTATAAGFVLQAHFLTADLPVTLWMLVAFFFAQSLYRTGRLRDYVLAGLLTGVATAAKYNGLAVGIAIPVFHFLANRSVPFHRMAFDRRLVISMVMVVGGFIAANPFAVITYSKFVSDFVYNYLTTPVYGGNDPSETSYFQFLGRTVEILGWPLFVATLLGTAVGIARLRRQAPAELATTLAAAAVFALYFWKFGSFPRLEVRFALSAIPFLLIAAAPGFGWLGRLAPRAATAALALIVAYNVYASIWVGYRFAADPRMESIDWVSANVPAGATIEGTNYAPNWELGLDVDFVRIPAVTGRYELLSEMFADNPLIMERLRSRDDSNDYVQWYGGAALRERHPDFVAVDSLYYNRFFDRAGEDYPTVKQFFEDLLAERLGYEIVYDGRSIASPRWLYPREMVFVDNRLVILRRAR